MEWIEFQTVPEAYRHWSVDIDGPVATVWMRVNESAGLFDGYELKLNSYDLGVDIELADIVQRMRFEQPQVRTVVLRSGRDRVFCAGANIRMLSGASHQHKVNFCKFTNETRNALEAAAEVSGQTWICAVQGSCAGGGYELALACNHILLADDSNSSVSLPEVPLLAVLPGTGGLTRLTDKRRVRRDLADAFCTAEEGVKGQRAVDWRLVDECVRNSRFEARLAECAAAFAVDSPPRGDRPGIALGALHRDIEDDGSLRYSTVRVKIERSKRIAHVHLAGPDQGVPEDLDALHRAGQQNWLLRCARELDDALLQLRFNEPEIGVLVFHSVGDGDAVLAHEQACAAWRDTDWLANETLQLWHRVLKRIDVSSRSLVTLVEPGSCFAGLFAEVALAADRVYMADGEFDDMPGPEASLQLSQLNLAGLEMGHGLTRLQNRFHGRPEALSACEAALGEPLDAAAADALGLVTWALDDIDWDDEVRVFLEERASFSPDALTGLEANLRFVGPETMETRIFARLSAWQNWIFQRPSAAGEHGALQRYGTGVRGDYAAERV
ncbi:MAG: 2,3-epoxybenzoyl-CoA dihydrolase [Pseudomonadota bacterium]